jgi:fibronectin-binding autotransporter adhesin
MSNLSGNQIFGFYQSGGATLTNQSTIQGSGTINPNSSNVFINQHIVNANQTTPLLISAGSGTVTNTGTLEATNGGTLVLEGNTQGGGTFDNTGGTIQAGAGSIVQLYDSAIVKNGNLSSTSTGKTQCNGSNGACTLDGVTITGTHQITTSYENLTNTVTNNGSFQMLGTSSNNVNLDILGSATLKGSGTLTMGGSGNTIFGFYQPSPGNTLTNQSTIQGGGPINPSSGNTFINENIVNANKSTPLIINGNFTNAKNGNVIGTLKVAKPSTLYISGGLFSNFSALASTLTGGKYMVTGTLQFDGAYILTNAAAITLTGNTSRIINQSGSDALPNIATNTSAGSFSVMPSGTTGKMLTTTIQNGVFSNAGKVTVGAYSGFQITAPVQNPPVFGTYVQTAGTTTVDGVLTAQGGVTINKGNLMGKGTIAASVVSSGAVTAGDSATKPGILSLSTYTQKTVGTAIGSLIIPITSDTAFGQLAVSNGASVSGPLSIKRLSTYVPAIGRTYTVLTASAITGSFSNSTVAINSGEHFAISYNRTSTPQIVTVTVVSGP